MFIKVASCLTTPLCYVMYQRITLFIATSSPPKFSQKKESFSLICGQFYDEPSRQFSNLCQLSSATSALSGVTSPLCSLGWNLGKKVIFSCERRNT